MPLPIVAIVGRPNVGKSALLNWLARRRISIVDPTAGVTRDRVSTVCQEDEVYFELVDTGGFGIPEADQLGPQIEQQILFAVAQAELILLVVDVQAGLTSLDRQVAELLRQREQMPILVVNKTDSPQAEPAAAEFYRLGFGQPIAVSALHSRNRAELMDAIVERLQTTGDRPEQPEMRLAIVGKRNVGKSTFINVLAGQERVIVSEMPGTTRDSVDVRFERDGKSFMAIDTAGVRKRGKIADSIEFYGQARTHDSIRRCDVVLLMLDAAEPISEVDKKLVDFISQEYKPCLLVVNKWDLARGQASFGDYAEYLRKTLPAVVYAPVALTAAHQGRGIDHTMRLAGNLFRQSQQRITTGPLNRAVEQALGERAPPAGHGRGRRGSRRPRIYYATQASTAPPTIVLFVNDPALIGEQYRRFLVRRLRTLLPFPQIPIRLLFRSHRAEPTRARRGSG